MSNKGSGRYSEAGVDVTAGYESVRRIRRHVESTARPGVLGGIGGFGGLFEIGASGGFKRPVTVSGTDGVGTKLKIAFVMDRHDTVGVDCVAMCCNDIVCSGAEPLFFLDYLAVGKNKPERVEEIVAGVARGCREAGCALIGGETAEHPGLMPEDEYDIAGFSVGVVDYDKIIDGAGIVPGDVIIALESSGMHSNGYSLTRKILGQDAAALGKYSAELSCTLGEELLRPTRIYVGTVLALVAEYGSEIKGVCHITGGGLYENAGRCLPEGVTASLRAGAFPKKPIFDMVERLGNVEPEDMFGTYNMGAGLVLFAREELARDIMKTAESRGESTFVAGECVAGEKGVEIIW
jgi:phosphoribosylformylglycinamidine cyclo-ligase